MLTMKSLFIHFTSSFYKIVLLPVTIIHNVWTKLMSARSITNNVNDSNEVSFYELASAKIVSNGAHRGRPCTLPVTGLSAFWQVFVVWVLIRSTWRLCHFIEQAINFRLLALRFCHLNVSFILRPFSKKA